MAARSALTIALLVVAVAATRAQAEESIDMDYTEEDVASDDSTWALYERWAVHNNVTRDSEERIRRFPIFKENARRILDVNRQEGSETYSGCLKTYSVGLSIFADMTSEEILNLCLTGLRLSAILDYPKPLRPHELSVSKHGEAIVLVSRLREALERN